MSSKVTFFGAVKQVTGSCYLLKTDRARVLLECGMHQGPPEIERLNREPFPFDVKKLDAVVLSHAHLDHSGLLPKLARSNYRGPIYCARPTRGLLKIMLMDAAYLEQRDTDWENTRLRRAGRALIDPIYTLDDVRRVLRQCVSISYHQPTEVAHGVQVQYLDTATSVLG